MSARFPARFLRDRAVITRFYEWGSDTAMGTFGHGNFENDVALDWTDSLKERKSLKKLKETLEPKKGIQVDDEELLACAEIVAALNGYPGDDIDPDLEEWALKNAKKDNSHLIKVAIQSVEKLLHTSDLKNSWEETEHFHEWLAVQTDLLNRLRSDRRDDSATSLRKVPVVELLGDGLQSKRFKVSAPLPDPTQPCGKWGIPHSVFIRVSQDITTEEYTKIAAWLALYPDTMVRLSDYPRKRGFRWNGALLLHFKGVTRLHLQVESAKLVDELAQFIELRELTLHLCHAEHPIAPLVNLPLLEVLKISSPAQEGIANDFHLLGKLQFLKEFELTSPIHYTFSGSGMQKQRSDKIITTDRFPDLSPRIERIVLRQIRCQNLESLYNLHELRSLELESVETDTKIVDLSRISKLRKLEVDALHGVKELRVPSSLVYLKIHNSPNQTLCTESMPELRGLSIPASLLAAPGFEWKNMRFLRYVHIYEATAGIPLQKLEELPGLQYVWIELKGGHLPDLSRFKSLKYLYLAGVSSLSQLKGLKAPPHVEEVDVYFEMLEELELPVNTFDNFKSHPTLQQLRICGWFEDNEADKKILERLNIKNDAPRLSLEFLRGIDTEVDALSRK